MLDARPAPVPRRVALSARHSRCSFGSIARRVPRRAAAEATAAGARQGAMFIEEIVVDGFKSYAQRTTVPNFDPFFNAITGLNGSGKSNILDSICFVLGITNLSQVRASGARACKGLQFENRTRRCHALAQVRAGSLQELVYKQGQAGVTKASVSIVFNNSDPTRSPVGYESCEQITVTRQARPPRASFGGELRDVGAQPKRAACRLSSAAATSTSSMAKWHSRGAPPRDSCAAPAAARR